MSRDLALDAIKRWRVDTLNGVVNGNDFMQWANAVVEYLADEIVVMQAGRAVEQVLKSSPTPVHLDRIYVRGASVHDPIVLPRRPAPASPRER